ncbi:MAG: glycosyltransferase family 4 protein, partial [Patescibacteria group bacterium]|nr:glycosyltransferase family 4 protein [Patescibacteria group bacterium]
LILTQKVDANDDVLGFFHGWIKEFAKHCEEMTVVALGAGEYDLPKNVRVLSLGKEEEVSRLTYIIRFYRYLWSERKNYDTVFVHMNQEYILLGGLVWKCLGKKVALWRNHYAGSFFTRIAIMLSDHIFCTSKYSFTARSQKTILMPVGIDTELFKKEDGVVKKPHSILFLARISPSKKPHLIIEALRKVGDKGIDFTADFYGNSLPQDVPYLNSLKEKVKEYSLGDRVTFEKGVPNRETPRVYGAHAIFINASPSGMYDKTIFEAMACESLVLTSNMNLKGNIDDMFLFKEDDEEDLAKQLRNLLAVSFEEKEELGRRLRAFVVSQHSLTLLGDKLIKCLAL